MIRPRLLPTRLTTPVERLGFSAAQLALLWPLGGFFLLALLTQLTWPSHLVHRVGDFGSHTLYQSFIGLAAVLFIWRALREGPKTLLWWPPAVALGCGLCVEVLKRATLLPRPDGDPTGFPSGHTTFSFALAWLLTQTNPKLAPLWYAVAVAIGWSRVEGDAHFPYQVLCGAVLGTLVGWCISRALPVLPARR